MCGLGSVCLLAAACDAIETDPSLPSVKLQEGASVVEVLERIVQSLKEGGVTPKVISCKLINSPSGQPPQEGGKGCGRERKRRKRVGEP